MWLLYVDPNYGGFPQQFSNALENCGEFCPARWLGLKGSKDTSFFQDQGVEGSLTITSVKIG